MTSYSHIPSALVFDLDQCIGDCRNWLEPLLRDEKIVSQVAGDLVARLSRCKGQVEQLEQQNERLHELLKDKLNMVDTGDMIGVR